MCGYTVDLLLPVLSERPPSRVRPTAAVVALWRTHQRKVALGRRGTATARARSQDGWRDGLGGGSDATSRCPGQTAGRRPAQATADASDEGCSRRDEDAAEDGDGRGVEGICRVAVCRVVLSTSFVVVGDVVCRERERAWLELPPST